MKKVTPKVLSEVRKEISKYICKNRLIKVTIFKQYVNYFGTLIFSKKSNVYGYSKLNPTDKNVNKSIGTLFAAYRYINSLPTITPEEAELLKKIYSVIPVGYKKFVKQPLFSDKYVDIIRHHSYTMVPGYNRISFNVDFVKYESMMVNGLEACLSNQNLTRKYYNEV